MNYPIISTKIEAVIQNLQKKKKKRKEKKNKGEGPYGFTGEFYQTFRE